MMEIYRKIYNGKITTEVSYYFEMNNRGKRKYYKTVYEAISDFSYEHSEYDVTIDGQITNLGKIENDVFRCTPILFSKLKAQRRLAILSKFVLYVISTINNIPIYKLPKEVIYIHNGVEIQLSPNAFTKATYELIPRFEKIYRPE